jgi:hypothetical protein
VEEYLGAGEKIRLEEWTSSIAVGNRSFVEHVNTLLGFGAKGREVLVRRSSNQKKQLAIGT